MPISARVAWCRATRAEAATHLVAQLSLAMRRGQGGVWTSSFLRPLGWEQYGTKIA